MRKSNTNKKTVVIILFCVIGLLYSLNLFNTGYHNMDLGQNLYYLEEKLNTDIYDITLQGKKVSPEQLYINGVNNMHYAFYLFGYFSFIAGILLQVFYKKLSDDHET